MLLHPSFFLFFIFLIISIIMILSSSSWFMAWIALEVSMLAFIPMILKKMNKYTAETALKYFLVQSLASILIILSMVLMIYSYQTSYFVMIMTVALSLKLGAAPFHQWAPSLIEGLAWQSLMVFFIIQKINPLILLISCNLTLNINNQMLFIIIITSSLIGAIGGLNQVSTRKILTFSSISHLSWMLSAIYMASSLWMLHYLIYSLVLMCTLNIMKNKQAYTMNHMLLKEKKYSLSIPICLFSLGGLPPFSGFIPKLMISLTLVNNSNTLIFLFLMSSTFLSLFFYMRVILSNTLMSNSYKINYYNKKDKQMNNFMNIIFLMTPLIFFIV